jgi:hypothetical protein
LPRGLSVVTVIKIFFPISPFFGVYVNANGDALAVTGLMEPVPFSDIVTIVALPPNVLPLIVTEVIPHLLPLVLLNVTVGGLTHCPAVRIEINKKRPTK